MVNHLEQIRLGAKELTVTAAGKLWDGPMTKGQGKAKPQSKGKDAGKAAAGLQRKRVHLRAEWD